MRVWNIPPLTCVQSICTSVVMESGERENPLKGCNHSRAHRFIISESQSSVLTLQLCDFEQELNLILLGGSGGWSIVPYSKRLRARFPIGACKEGNGSMSLSPFLSLKSMNISTYPRVRILKIYMYHSIKTKQNKTKQKPLNLPVPQCHHPLSSLTLGKLEKTKQNKNV